MAEEMQNTMNQNLPEVQPDNSMPPETPKTGSKNMLVLFSVVLIFAVVLLAAGGYVYLTSKNKTATPVYTQAVPTAVPTNSPSPTGVTSINNASDLDSALNEVNSLTDTDLQNDLNLANSEGSNF